MSYSALQKFIKTLESDPLRIRKHFVSVAGVLTSAENAYLVLPGQSQHLIYWRKQPSLSEPQQLIDAFENTTRQTLWAGNHWLLRLKSQRRTVGLLILRFRKVKSGAGLQKVLAPLCGIYLNWETTQHLRRMIEIQQKSLQNLSAESAAVAQDYVRLTQQMQANQNRLQSITKGILRTQEEERAKISRDLHDGIGQELTALKMNLDVLSPVVEKNLLPDHQERWNEARSIAEQALQDVRELSRLLRPRMLDDLGLFPTLRWYIRSFIKRVNIAVELELGGDEERLNPEKQTILFRVVQEALNNVAKHSQAKSAAVRLECNDQEAYLRIRDDGVGFDPEIRSAETGSGLAGMRDRVMLYKGRFDVQSEPSKGTQLEIFIPL